MQSTQGEAKKGSADKAQVSQVAVKGASEGAKQRKGTMRKISFSKQVARWTRWMCIITAKVATYAEWKGAEEWFTVSRIGEASNPGPAERHVELHSVNVTSMAKYISDLVTAEADILCVQEARLTKEGQTKYKPIWKKKKWDVAWGKLWGP